MKKMDDLQRNQRSEVGESSRSWNDLNKTFSDPINLISSERSRTKSSIPLTVIGGGDGGGLTGSIISFEATFVECSGGFTISLLASTARREYLFDVENILFCDVFAILFEGGKSDDDRFRPDFLEFSVEFSTSISELSKTVSLDTLCMRLGEAEFE